MDRIQIDAIEPEAYKPMFDLEGYLNQSKLSHTHKNLIKIRASQLNGCAFCIDLHAQEAIQYGEDHRRIFLLDGWTKTKLFSKEEKVILKMTEEITLIHLGGLSDATYGEAKELFDDHYVAQLIMAITVINAWNRIAVSTLKPLPDEA